MDNSRRNFIYTIGREVVPSPFLPLQGTWIIPLEWMSGIPQDMAGARIWLTRGGPNPELLACLTVAQVEEQLEEPRRGAFILTSDILDSFPIFSRLPNAADKKTSRLGLTPLDVEETKVLQELIQGLPRYIFGPPDASLVASIPFAPGSLPLARQARLAMRQCLSFIPLSRLKKYHKLPSWSPYAVAAGLLMQRGNPGLNDSDLFELLAPLDPLHLKGAEHLDTNSSGKGQVGIISSVDLDFRLIDPEQIRARRFLSSTTVSPAGNLEATDRAEGIHQEILRRLARGLIEMGLHPAQSSSLDLVVSSETSPILFEIKSATPANVSAQVCQAMVQLMTYELACSSAEIGCSGAAIVIQHCDVPIQTISELAALVKRAGFQLFEFDMKSEWPVSSIGLEKWIREILTIRENPPQSSIQAPLSTAG